MNNVFWFRKFKKRKTAEDCANMLSWTFNYTNVKKTCNGNFLIEVGEYDS